VLSAPSSAPETISGHEASESDVIIGRVLVGLLAVQSALAQDEAQAAAGRRGQQPVALARDIVEKLLQADVPGKINPVLQAIDRRARHCAYCGKDLPRNATRRRKYCGAKCRVAWNRPAATPDQAEKRSV
jgi:hypothetical protein